jgi:hypothetical protein
MAQLKIAFVRNCLALISLSGLLLLTGCATTPTTIVADVPRNPIVLPSIDVLQLDSVDWVIVTETNYKEVFAALKKQGLNPVIFGLSENGYKRLAINTAKIRSMLQQQKAVMEAYRLYYDEDFAKAKKEEQLKEEKKVKDEANVPWWKKMFGGSDPAPAKPAPVTPPVVPVVTPAPAAPVIIVPNKVSTPVKAVLPPELSSLASITPTPTTSSAKTKTTVDIPPVKPVTVR